MDFIAIIPARYASSRFPGKPLADMKGKTMIQRVCEQVGSVLEKVYVATDDPRIFDVVLSFGGNPVMTSPDHKSGTDRCYEAYRNIGGKQQVIVNIQGDEPFIHPEQIRALLSCFDNPATEIATLVRPFTAADGKEALFNPNSPKVVLNNRREAIFFSRSVIPYLRGKDTDLWLESHTFYKHIGMYAYRADILEKITTLPQSELEKAESLEQLRWLENGYRIQAGITSRETLGIDTPEDLEKALALLQ